MAIRINLPHSLRVAGFLAVILTVGLLAACGDDPTPTPASTSAPTSIPTITYELEVVVEPQEAAIIILNPKPDSSGAFAAVTAVTMEVLPKEGWQVEKWVGPTYGEAEGSATINMDSSHMVAVKLVRIEAQTPVPTPILAYPIPAPTGTPMTAPTPTGTPTPPQAQPLTPTPTGTPTPPRAQPLTPTPTGTPAPTSTLRFQLRIAFDPEGSGTAVFQPATPDQRYLAGTVVKVTPLCELGFLQWSGDLPPGVSRTRPTIQVIMDKDRHLEATCRRPTATPAPEKAVPVNVPRFNGSFNWETYGLPKPTKFSESPIFAKMVSEGRLPPVAERLPIAADVMVLPVIDRIGDYGGTWRRGFTGPKDGQNADRLMSDHMLHFDLNGVDVIPNVID